MIKYQIIQQIIITIIILISCTCTHNRNLQSISIIIINNTHTHTNTNVIKNQSIISNIQTIISNHTNINNTVDTVDSKHISTINTIFNIQNPVINNINRLNQSRINGVAGLNQGDIKGNIGGIGGMGNLLDVSKIINTTTNTTTNTTNTTTAKPISIPTLPPPQNTTKPPQIPSTPFIIVSGVRKNNFTDRGLSLSNISPQLLSSPQFKLLKNIPIKTTIHPDLLQLKNIHRTYNGSSNNINNSHLGQVNTSLSRHCPAFYFDNISKQFPQQPSPRQVSNIVGSIRTNPRLSKQNITFAFTIWGQFIDHDIIHVPSSQNQIMHISIPKCDRDFDFDCKGDRVIPFTRSLFKEGTGVMLDQDGRVVVIEEDVINNGTNLTSDGMIINGTNGTVNGTINALSNDENNSITNNKSINSNSTTDTNQPTPTINLNQKQTISSKVQTQIIKTSQNKTIQLSTSQAVANKQNPSKQNRLLLQQQAVVLQQKKNLQTQGPLLSLTNNTNISIPVSIEQLSVPILPQNLLSANSQFVPSSQKQTINISTPGLPASQESKFKRIPRMPINDITTWIDGSMIYGSSNEHAKKLRTFIGGKLKTDDIGGRLLPNDHKVDPSLNITNKTNINKTMQAGDGRSNQNLVLLSYQTLFLRQHNRLCQLIIRNNNTLNDQDLYNIAKNYIIGLIQKITYDDYLPILLGPGPYKQLIGEYKGYDQNVDPTIEVQFSTAGFRFGHSLLVDTVKLVGIYGDVLENVRLSDAFFRPQKLNSMTFQQILRGATRTITKQRDGEFVDQIRNFLILGPQLRGLRMDLLSLNIQRGRDHGLPHYNQLRQCYGLNRIQNFSQISDQAQKNTKLETAYKQIDNIDSYIAIQAQKAVQGSILGDTGIAIVGNTFRKLRAGDRFWYQRAYPPKIIQEIKNTKLSEIIMRNTAIGQLQEDVFHYSFGIKMTQ